MQTRDPLQPRRLCVLRPLAEQLAALAPDHGVGQLARAAHAQALQQRLVRKRALEARPRVLDQPVEERQRAHLPVHVAVLELLADGARGLGRAGRLQLDGLDELDDARQVVL